MSVMFRLAKLAGACALAVSIAGCQGGSDGFEESLGASVQKIQATDDNASGVDGKAGGVAVANVLANDTLGAAAATTANIALSEASADASGVLKLNADGSVTVAAGSAPDTYTLTYQICQVDVRDNCDTATVSVEVVPGLAKLFAADDTIADVNGGAGVTGALNVLDNDTVDGVKATTDLVSLSEETADPEGMLTLNADGSVDVASGALAGNYSLTYKICEKTNPENCETATVSITTTVEKGVFMKGEVSGLSYTTGGYTDVTGDDGSFFYQPGDAITFAIGGTPLGETVEAKPEMSPLDLVPGATPPRDRQDTVDAFIREYRNYGADPETDARYRLNNVVQLLYSADSDKDISNGISVNPELHTLLAETTLNLAQMPHAFHSSFGYRKALFEAFRADLMESARRIDRVIALDHMFTLAEQNVELYALKSFSHDWDADGNAENSSDFFYDERGFFTGTEETNYLSPNHSFQRILGDFGELLEHLYSDPWSTSWYRRTYDAHGYLQRTENDWNYDDVIDAFEDFTYDEFGSLLEQRSTATDIRRGNQVTTYEYDARGNQTLYARDVDGDGNINYAYHYRYDDADRRIFYGYDSNGDGNFEHSESSVFDESGNLLSRSIDYTGDGIADNERTYEYDEQGNIIRDSNDGNGDGIPDSVNRYTYDANGNRTETWHDYDGDGTPESTTSNEFDVNGNQTRWERDNNGDGTPDYIEIREYDGAGNLTLQAVDYDGNGIPEFSEVREYDSTGFLITIARDQNADGTPEYLETYARDANGNPTLQAIDTNADGTPDYLYHYEYNAANQVTYSGTDYDGNGSIDSSVSYGYDEQGNRVLEEHDLDGNGNADMRLVREYVKVSWHGLKESSY